MELLVPGSVVSCDGCQCECGCYDHCQCDSETCLCDNKGEPGCAKY